VQGLSGGWSAIPAYDESKKELSKEDFANSDKGAYVFFFNNTEGRFYFEVLPNEHIKTIVG
jgi:hypothetical protein